MGGDPCEDPISLAEAKKHYFYLVNIIQRGVVRTHADELDYLYAIQRST
jgi:hypothetical protein